MIFIFLQFLLLFPLLCLLFSIDKAKQKGKVHLYGIYGYFGLPGRGKTMCMCYELDRLRKKYGNKIYIMTNFNYTGQDFEFNTWKQLLQEYDRPLVVAWDEIQNVFNSRDFKNFPIQLLTLLTQVRKNNGIRLLYTAQRYHFVDKNFRSLTAGCYDCSTWLGRFTFARMYYPDEYEEKINQVNCDKKMKIKAKKTISFIQSEKLRNSYDSFKMLQSAKNREYMTREEIAAIENLV